MVDSPEPVCTAFRRTSERAIIIHCDDLGMASSINSAAFDALNDGTISSASIMVPGPWFPQVAAYSRQHGLMDFGIHLTLTSEWNTCRWGPVATKEKVQSLVDDQGYFWKTPALFLANADPHEVELELNAQITLAISAGVRLTHYDSHMFALLPDPTFRAIYIGVARAHKLPFLLPRSKAQRFGLCLAVEDMLVDYCYFASRRWSRKNWLNCYLSLIRALPAGVTELIVHLSQDDAEMRAMTRGHADCNGAWRQRDLEVVRSTRFKRALRDNDVQILGWQDLTR
jgi:chitin disaccharide deacetylase